MTVFIDSDVLIEVLKGQDEDLLAAWSALGKTDAALLFSPVSVAEVWAAARSYEHVQINQIFRPLLCASIDHETGKLAGEYLRKFSRSHDLKVADALVAASAFRHNSALWTHDRKRYPMQELSFYK
ncbi:MAG TPA: PIN domain-containing protein [Terracidiphilus sp.]